MKRWKIRQRLIYAVQPSISLCHSIYRRQFSKLDRPQHSFHHSHFHYIFDARSVCIGIKHAPNTNSVRYSAVYVINVSIVTINDIHWSIYIGKQQVIQSRRKQRAYKHTAHPVSKQVQMYPFYSFIRCYTFAWYFTFSKKPFFRIHNERWTPSNLLIRSHSNHVKIIQKLWNIHLIASIWMLLVVRCWADAVFIPLPKWILRARKPPSIIKLENMLRAH